MVTVSIGIYFFFGEFLFVSLLPLQSLGTCVDRLIMNIPVSFWIFADDDCDFITVSVLHIVSTCDAVVSAVLRYSTLFLKRIKMKPQNLEIGSCSQSTAHIFLNVSLSI